MGQEATHSQAGAGGGAWSGRACGLRRGARRGEGPGAGGRQLGGPVQRRIRLYCLLSARRRAEGGRGPGRPLGPAEPSPPFRPWRARQSLSFLPTSPPRPAFLSQVGGHHRGSPRCGPPMGPREGAEHGLASGSPAPPARGPPRAGPEACCPGRLSEHSCSLLGGGCRRRGGRRVDGKARGQQRARSSG